MRSQRSPRRRRKSDRADGELLRARDWAEARAMIATIAVTPALRLSNIRLAAWPAVWRRFRSRSTTGRTQAARLSLQRRTRRVRRGGRADVQAQVAGGRGNGPRYPGVTGRARG